MMGFELWFSGEEQKLELQMTGYEWRIGFQVLVSEICDLKFEI